MSKARDLGSETKRQGRFACDSAVLSLAPMTPTPIVDAHHRLDPVEAKVELLRPLLVENNVATTVIVQSEPSIETTKGALNLAGQTDFVGGVVAWVDVSSPDLEAVLEELCNNPKMKGVCLSAYREPDNHWLTRDATLAGLRLVEMRGLSVDVIAEPRLIPAVQDLALALPKLRIALAHIGSPFIARSEREPWGVYMLNLAPFRNVSVKLTGLVTMDTQPQWSTAHLKLFVEPMVRLFGYERMMFGSDWPNHSEVATYRQVMDAVVEAAGPMKDEQVSQVLGGTAALFYRIS